MSNFGLMVRYLHEHEAPDWRHRDAFDLALQDVHQNRSLLAHALGQRTSEDLLEAIELLEATVGQPLKDATLIGPCLEGVGHYPLLRPRTLAWRSVKRAWVAGDASGAFRGLVPALVSGYYAGYELADELRESEGLGG
jgi:uncharacterized FAD-dependent dehydrogenase